VGVLGKGPAEQAAKVGGGPRLIVDAQMYSAEHALDRVGHDSLSCEVDEIVDRQGFARGQPPPHRHQQL
jgi:hypothetical protein